MRVIEIITEGPQGPVGPVGSLGTGSLAISGSLNVSGSMNITGSVVITGSMTLSAIHQGAYPERSGSEGEYMFANSEGQFYMYAFLSGSWRRAAFNIT